MAFEIKLCARDACDGGITVTDTTGFFSVDNPFGYNAPPTPGGAVPTLSTAGVFGYSSYTLLIYRAIQGGVDLDADPSPPPDLTINLLTWPHTIDEETGNVTWTFTPQQLGVEQARSGWWLFRGEGVWVNSEDEEYTYPIYSTVGLLGDLCAKVDAMMLKASPAKCGGCGGGKRSPYEMYLLFNPLASWAGECQNYEGFTNHVDYLYHNIPLCGCC